MDLDDLDSSRYGNWNITYMFHDTDFEINALNDPPNDIGQCKTKGAPISATGVHIAKIALWFAVSSKVLGGKASVP